VKASAILAGATLIGVLTAPLAARAQDPDEVKPSGPASGDARDAPDAEARDADLAKDEAAFARAKGVKLTFRLGVRFLQSSPFSKTYTNVLAAYGYTSMAALVEGAADVAVSPWRYIDVGVHTGYAFGSGGTSGGSGGMLSLHELEVGGFAYTIFGRTDVRKAGTFGVGAEGGGMFPFMILRGDVSRTSVPYVGPVLLARLFGDTRVQTAVHVRYLVANWPGAFNGVGLPLGGFSISVGANLSL
jgi:hypothetical protein